MFCNGHMTVYDCIYGSHAPLLLDEEGDDGLYSALEIRIPTPDVLEL